MDLGASAQEEKSELLTTARVGPAGPDVLLQAHVGEERQARGLLLGSGGQELLI